MPVRRKTALLLLLALPVALVGCGGGDKDGEASGDPAPGQQVNTDPTPGPSNPQGDPGTVDPQPVDPKPVDPQPVDPVTVAKVTPIPDVRYVTEEHGLVIVTHPMQALGSAIGRELPSEFFLGEAEEESGVNMAQVETAVVLIKAPPAEALLPDDHRKDPGKPFVPNLDNLDDPVPPTDDAADGPAEADADDPESTIDQDRAIDPKSTIDPNEEPPYEEFERRPRAEEPLMILHLAVPVDRAKVVGHNHLEDAEKRTMNGADYYVQEWGPTIAFMGEKTLVVGPEKAVETLLGTTGGNGKGPLAARLAATDTSADAVVVGELSGHRETIAKVQDGFAKELPEQAQQYLALAESVDGFVLRIDSSAPELLRVDIAAKDAESTEAIRLAVDNGVQLGKALYPVFVRGEIKGEMKDQILPVLDALVKETSVSKSGTTVSVVAPRPEGLLKLTQSVRPILEQAVAQQRAEAAIRKRENRLYEIIDHLDRHAADNDGVMIPAAKQEGDKIVSTWRTDAFENHEELFVDAELGGKQTRYLLVTGPGMLIEKPGDALMEDRAFDKGAMPLVVEVAADKSVPYDQPGDYVFDPADPLKAIGKIGPEGLFVLTAGRGVRTIPATASKEAIVWFFKGSDFDDPMAEKYELEIDPSIEFGREFEKEFEKFDPPKEGPAESEEKATLPEE